MAQSAFFFLSCPVCARSLRMPVDWFGKRVNCVHCGGEFRAEEQALRSLMSAPGGGGISTGNNPPAAPAAEIS